MPADWFLAQLSPRIGDNPAAGQHRLAIALRFDGFGRPEQGTGVDGPTAPRAAGA